MCLTEDTKGFHQTCHHHGSYLLLQTHSAPPDQGPAQHAFQRGPQISKQTGPHGYYFFASPPEKKLSWECFHFQVFFSLFQLCFNVIETYQNKKGRLFLKALHNRFSYFFLNLHLFIYAVLIFQILIFCTPKTNTILYINYISICLKKWSGMCGKKILI